MRAMVLSSGCASRGCPGGGSLACGACHRGAARPPGHALAAAERHGQDRIAKALARRGVRPHELLGIAGAWCQIKSARAENKYTSAAAVVSFCYKFDWELTDWG